MEDPYPRAQTSQQAPGVNSVTQLENVVCNTPLSTTKRTVLDVRKRSQSSVKRFGPIKDQPDVIHQATGRQQDWQTKKMPLSDTFAPIVHYSPLNKREVFPKGTNLEQRSSGTLSLKELGGDKEIAVVELSQVPQEEEEMADSFSGELEEIAPAKTTNLIKIYKNVNTMEVRNPLIQDLQSQSNKVLVSADVTGSCKQVVELQQQQLLVQQVVTNQKAEPLQETEYIPVISRSEVIAPSSTSQIISTSGSANKQNAADIKTPSQVLSHIEDNEEPILSAKMHRKNKPKGEVAHVPVGQGLKKFLATHPLVTGLYLNRGKRDVKRHLVGLQRHNQAVDCGSWQRGSQCHERNRLDDHFIPSPEGHARISLIKEKRIRDEYVVNWYLWCPGHGNCRRKCGGYGKCVEGMLIISN